MNRKVTVAGIIEQTKLIHTKKGETMAIITIEDPTGRMEVTLFPRVYTQFKDLLEKPNSLLVLAGSLDLRMGQPQLKAEAIKRVSLETMVTKAKQEGMFNESETERWSGRGGRHSETEDSSAGDGVAEEEVVPKTKTSPHTSMSSESLLGPLASWINAGMQTEEPLRRVGLEGYVMDKADSEKRVAGSKTGDEHTIDESTRSRLPAHRPSISIHTVTLPAKAPRQLLLDVKSIFETFSGSEKVQLRIGDQVVPVGLTVTMSPLLEKRVEEAVKKYSGL